MESTTNSLARIKREKPSDPELTEAVESHNVIVYVQDDSHPDECIEHSNSHIDPGRKLASNPPLCQSSLSRNSNRVICHKVPDFRSTLLRETAFHGEIISKKSHCRKLKKKVFICSFEGCNKEFGKNSRLLLHERTHTGERPHSCPYDGCESAYTRQFHLTRHISHSHSEQNQIQTRVDCEKCGRSYSNVYALKKHYRIHEEDRFTCLTCGQIFRKAQHLVTHSYKHTLVPPYKCDFPGCEKRFSVPSKRKRHQQIHLEGRYGCQHPLCEETFNTYPEMLQHSSRTHKKACIVCQKEFHMMCRLKKHLETHKSLEDFFFCPFAPCDCYYLSEEDLFSHTRKNHEKEYGCVCHMCGERIDSQPKLREHTQQRHSFIKSEKVAKPKKFRSCRRFFNAGYLHSFPGLSASESSIKEEQTETESPGCDPSYADSKEETSNHAMTTSIFFPEVLIKEESDDAMVSSHDSEGSSQHSKYFI